MQQNSPFYLLRIQPQPPLKLKAKAKSAFLSLLFGMFLMLGIGAKASAQVFDTTAGRLMVDTLPQADSTRPVQARPVTPAIVTPAHRDTTATDTSGASAATEVQADSTLQQALKPFSLELPGSKEHTPKGATIRSLILPGWGQAYNHEYWKVPLAVAAVGIPIYLFLDNSKEYNSAREAYSVVFEEMPVISGGKGKLDAAKFAKVDQKFQDAYNRYKQVGGNYVTNFLSTVQSYRNTFRQYRDYSIVAALLGWGLQIADATVFGHLHGFNVSDDISMKVRPVYFQYAKIPGIGLSINF